MTPHKDRIQEKLSRLNRRTYRLSAKLLAWATLLERQNDHDDFAALEGLGISLREYGRILKRTSHSLDEIELEFETMFNKSAPSKGGRK